MAADDDEVTDNIPVPGGKDGATAKPAVDGPPVTLESGDQVLEGKLQTASGDQVTVLTQQTLPMDAQVNVKTADGTLSGTGVVIWNRASDDQGVAVGIEILGGADDWSALLA